MTALKSSTTGTIRQWRFLERWHVKVFPHLSHVITTRASIIDIFNYGDFYFDEAIREAAANYEANVAKIDAAVASLMKFVEEP